jgi:hypothetical protein
MKGGRADGWVGWAGLLLPVLLLLLLLHVRALLALVSFRFVLFVPYTLILRRCWEVGRVYLGLLASPAGWLVLSRLASFLAFTL